MLAEYRRFEQKAWAYISVVTGGGGGANNSEKRAKIFGIEKFLQFFVGFLPNFQAF